MTRGCSIATVVLLSLCAPAVAGNLDDTSPDEKSQGQVGLHAKVGSGYRGIFRDADEYCGVNGEDLCLARTPLFLDLGVSYRVLERLDILFEVRVGLERDFGATPAVKGVRNHAYAPGVKVYFKDAGTAKFWSSLAFEIETTDYPQKPETDYGMRLTNAFQFDPHHTVGVYFFFGPVFAWKRWLRFEIEGGVGLQARFP